MTDRTIFDTFKVSPETLTKIVEQNPSLRGMLLGYLAEAKLAEHLQRDGRITNVHKADDHDRSKKGDLVMTYRGHEFKVEVKSLQTNTIEMFDKDANRWLHKVTKNSRPSRLNDEYVEMWNANKLDANYRGQFQCDASDKRRVQFPDGSVRRTTNLLVGEFHIVAAGLFAFREEWDFAFALNSELPRLTSKKFTKHQRNNLIKSTIPITWPTVAPFTLDIYQLLDRLVDNMEEPARQIDGPELQPLLVIGGE